MFCGGSDGPVAGAAADFEDMQGSVWREVGQGELAVEQEGEGLVFDGEAGGFGVVVGEEVGGVGIGATVFVD